MSKLNHVFKLLLSDTGFVFVAATMASGFSFLATLLMARVLNNSTDFGIYGSCITLYNYTVILGNTVQTGTTRTVAQLQARSGVVGVKHFQRPAFLSLLRIGLLLFLPLALLSVPLAGFLQISPWLIVIVFSCAIMLGPLFMTVGTLQGLQSFRLFGVSLNVLALTRLIGSVVLTVVGLGVLGATIALPISVLVNIVANAFMVYWVIRRRERRHALNEPPPDPDEIEVEHELLRHPLKTFFTTSFFALFGIFSFALLTSVDVLIVRHFFPDKQAGHYAVIALLGKAVLYFSAPIALVALPKMSHAHEAGENVGKTFRRNFWLTIGACLIPVAILAALSSFILKLFAPDAITSDLTLLVPLYGVVMLLYSIVTLWIYLFVAIGRNRYMFIVLAAAVLEVGLLFTFNANLTQIVLVIGIPALLLWAAGEVELRFYLHEYKKAAAIREALVSDYAVATPIPTPVGVKQNKG